MERLRAKRTGVPRIRTWLFAIVESRIRRAYIVAMPQHLSTDFGVSRSSFSMNVVFKPANADCQTDADELFRAFIRARTIDTKGDSS